MASELYLTEYERERQKKIEENKRLLETLGIFETRSVLDASTLNVDVVKPKRNYIKRARVQLEPRRSERVSIRPATSYAESDDSGTESDKPKPKGAGGIRKLNSYFSVRKTMWKPFYGQEIATCHICLVRNRQPKTKCSRCYADFWRGHVCRGCYEANFTSDDIESFDEARENPNWVCFVCRGICTCKFCRVGSTKRGKRYTKKRPIEEEEALALAQGQSLQIKEERDSDDGQFLPRKRGRGRPPKSRMSDPNQSLLMGSDPGDEEDQFDHPLFEGQLDHYHQLDQLEQLEQLQEQLNHLEQLDQLEQLEKQEREQERMRQEQLALTDPMHAQLAHLHVPHAQVMPQIPLKRGRGRPPKNPQQQQFKRQKHEQLHKYQHKPRQSRHKTHEYSDVPDQDMKHDVQVKQEPLLDDSLLGHDTSLMHDHMLLHDHMLMLPEQPMLHEHILQDIPPLQEHPLQLPMMHTQSNFQDLSQDHSIQDQLFRDHAFQQPFHNSFIHHTHHNHHNSTPSLANTSYTTHDFPSSHATSHFTTSNHHNHHTSANSILTNTSPTSLLLDNSLYQHPYFFQHLYYPQTQEMQQQQQDLPQHQHQQMQPHQHHHSSQLHMQDQQQDIHQQELHRQELHRNRQALHRQDDGDQRHSSAPPHHHHHLLHHDFVTQDQPDERQDPGAHRDILHPASVLQDQVDDYQHDAQDHYQSFQTQAYESHHESHDDPLDLDRSGYMDQIHDSDRSITLLHPAINLTGALNGPLNGNLNLNGMHITNPHHDMQHHHELDHQHQLKQEHQHHEMQQREHYHDLHSSHDEDDDDSS